jgi:helicase
LSKELPDYIQEFLRFKGIETLNPPQLDSIPYLVDTENVRSLVVSAPTGSGKTLIAEIGIVETLLIQRKKAVYLTPLRALATEKYTDFKAYKEKYDIKVAVRTGDYESKEEGLKDYDIIVSTYEKFDSMSRKGPDWLKEVGVVVVDEAHMLTDTERGPALECMLTRVRQRYPDARLLLLSAVMPNVLDFARWLNADFIESKWRAVPLKEGVFSWSKVVKHNCGSISARLTPKCKDKGCGRQVGGAISFSDGTARIVNSPGIEAAIQSLATDILNEGGQALIFARSRAETVKQAKNLGNILQTKILTHEQKGALVEFVESSSKLLDSSEQNADETLVLFSCVRNGTAFHNAGMSSALRKIVEDGFRKFLIKVVACTPTLAAGLNLPARRVIIQTINRWTREGSTEIPRWEFENMAGRAGRRAYDSYGEAVLVGEEITKKKVKSTAPTLSQFEANGNMEANKDEDEDPLMEYLRRPIEQIESKLFTRTALLAHMLAEICQEMNGVDREYIVNFFSASFGIRSGQVNQEAYDKVLTECFEFLVKYDLIRKDHHHGNFVATSLGRRISQMYINPASFENIQFAFFEAKKRLARWEKIHPAGWLHLVCSMQDWNFRSINLDYVDYDLDSSNLLLDDSCMKFETALEGAAVLYDYIEETEDKQIFESYSIGSGDLRTAQDNSEWLLASLKAIAEVLNENQLAASISVVLRRVQKGVKEELLSLASLKEVGRYRARVLFDRGIRTREHLLSEQNYIAASRILGEGTLRRILEENGVDLSKIELTPPKQARLG